MFNLKHKFVINDLVIIYLAEKLKSGCDNSLDEKEFNDFIKFFNEQKNTKFSYKRNKIQSKVKPHGKWIMFLENEYFKN